MHPLVSIIIPYYNGERFIAETLNSLLKQNYSNLEIIIVSDGLF
jgi:glycosyltransferase involved in cell wall biosynthesis